MSMDFSQIGVIGAGNIGIGVVTDLVLHGISAVVVDVSEEILQRAQAEVLNNVRVVPLLSKTLPRITADEALQRMVADDRSRGRGVVRLHHRERDRGLGRQEAGLRAARPSDAARGLLRRQHLVHFDHANRRRHQAAGATWSGVHFMNPVHLKPTVEVIRGFHTSDQTVDTLLQLFSRLDKEAIVVEDLPGFVSNRISHLFMNEAAFVLQDEVATAEKIDTIFKKCFGHKMGPLETADLIGLDTVMRSLDVLYESFQDPKYRCCPLLRKLVHAGHLGRKTGKGFHAYPDA